MIFLKTLGYVTDAIMVLYVVIVVSLAFKYYIQQWIKDE